MTKQEPVLHIPKIEEGIVIDHIPAGLGTRVLDIIRSYDGMNEVVITLALNCQSSRLGRKDLLKLEKATIPEHVLDHMALVSPGITIKRIRNYVVDKKFVISIPKKIVGLARCKNPNCISNNERDQATEFTGVRRAPGSFRCAFCERVFSLKELELKEANGS